MAAREPRRPTLRECDTALAAAENALLDYVDTLERQGGSMNYGRAVLARIADVRRRINMRAARNPEGTP